MLLLLLLRPCSRSAGASTAGGIRGTDSPQCCRCRCPVFAAVWQTAPPYLVSLGPANLAVAWARFLGALQASKAGSTRLGFSLHIRLHWVYWGRAHRSVRVALAREERAL